jgi:uncharacterized protein YraI
MKKTALSIAVVAAALAATSASPAKMERCRVMDPTGTPLNARTGPNGSILGKLPNGVLVSVIGQWDDEKGRPWVSVIKYGTGQPLGWVYREYIACF